MKQLILFLALIAVGLASCTIHRDVTTSGRATIITIDTTVINHGGTVNFKTTY